MIVGISGYVGTKLTGIGRVLIEVLKRIANINENDEYILFKNFDFYDYNELANIRNIKLVDINISKNSPLKNIIWHQWAFQMLQKQYKCDIAYIPNFSLLIWKIIPTVVTIHDLIEFNVPGKFSKLRMVYRKIIDPLMVRNSNYITTVSECSKKDIIKFCGAKEDKIKVITNAVDQKRFKLYDKETIDKVLNRHNLEYQSYFLFVGTIDYPGKNIMSIIKAYELLKSTKGVKEKLVIIGKNGFNAKIIYDYVNQSTYKESIIFTGYLEDSELPLLYAGCKIFIYLSLYEGFGLPVLEAMSCGVPVICSNTSCFPEVIGDLDVLVSPLDIKQIKEKIELLISNKDYYKTIAQESYKRAGHFSWEKSAQEYYNVFKNITINKRYDK
ncbi:glycosyltransferase family 4 protein [Phocaeicola coprophilus]|jgi:glycosyltransferase involved in cell wall biosynthesis|uniref:glycosyltransferase family 4 protein n=1 Tax=Phocaeicola coprophilus TaxID=387090 RepID=UPI0026DAFF93|nr:glycosyltransferase family 1 protein [Phocaeicola coprophilus]